MIIFDQLRVSDDGKLLYVDAHVSLADYFSEVTINSLIICTGAQVYETLDINPDVNTYIYKKTYDEVKEIHEVIDINDAVSTEALAPDSEGNLIYAKTDFSHDLFFVYVGCSNVPEECKCYLHVDKYVVGVTFDENLLYQKVMQFTKGLADNCQVPVEFTDFILLWNAFKASVETEHFIPAVKYYNMLFDKGVFDTGTMGKTRPCGCHG